MMFLFKRTCFCSILFILTFTLIFLLLFTNVSHLFTTNHPSSFSRLTDNGQSTSLFAVDTDMDHNRLLSWIKDKTALFSNSESVKTSSVHENVAIMPKMGNETLKAELGRSTWHLIHVMSNRYPTSPKPHEQEYILTFIHLLGKLYPCGECAAHFQEMVKLHPPEPHVSSRDSLAQYFCKMHNKVNLRLKHPIFDCNLVGDRWRCGCADDEEDVKAERTAQNGKFASASKSGGDERNQASLSSIERNLKMEFRSLFPEDYKEALALASEQPPKYPYSPTTNSI